MHEVVEIGLAERQDPHFLRTGGADVGRDGCRVPLPWEAARPTFGFGSGGTHLPQPEWFASLAVDAQASDPASMLSLYRRALALRRELQSGEQLEWVETGHDDVLRFRRPNGWEVVTNFGSEPYLLDDVSVVLASAPAPIGVVPAETTVWLGPERG
ncbi:MAG: hypothetical protein QM611_03935 [Microbacterium sp.]|uniref:alpha-amylase family glycosyl hydrolase n=1 Tax=Microbacterium sp. TaxID=51671 RepID=UPI0039E49B25